MFPELIGAPDNLTSPLPLSLNGGRVFEGGDP
jgi:hypothetical protein